MDRRVANRWGYPSLGEWSEPFQIPCFFRLCGSDKRNSGLEVELRAGARECLKLLDRYQRAYGAGNVSIRQSRIAIEIGRPLRSVQRWMSQLVEMKLIEVNQAGRGPADYFVKENGGAMAERWRSGAVPSLYELKRTEEKTSGPVAELVSQRLGACQLGAFVDSSGRVLRSGTLPDHGTLRRIGSAVGTVEGYWEFEKRYGARIISGEAQTWGLVVVWARSIPRKPAGSEDFMSRERIAL